MSFRARLRLAMLACALGPAGLAAQGPVFIRDAGPGRMAGIVGAILSRPYDVVAGDTADLVLRRDTTLTRTLVVIGRSVRVAAGVRGDLLVLNGRAYLRPGARIDGDIVATGGAVYNSTLATVGGERHSFRDETYVATRLADGSWALDYKALRTIPYALLTWPGIRGVRIPAYDRVNGLALPFGPFVSLDSGRISIEPLVTWRSHLGKLDPSVAGTIAMGRRNRGELLAGRTTLTNDDWINGDLGNSLNSFFTGRDTRNWYRADRVEAAMHRLYEGTDGTITPHLGARWERAWSTGIQSAPYRTAYSVLDRRDTVEGMARPNPLVDEGTITSLVGGFEAEWESPAQGLSVSGTGRVESSLAGVGDRFTQLTLDGRVTFPVVRDVEFRFEWHGVATAGRAPRQRYVYLGGSGTLPTVDLLSLGGDQLAYFESRVSKPLPRLALPLVGPPTLTLRHMMGSAGAGQLPGLTHNLALRLSVMLLRAEFVVDPVSRDTEFGVAFSFTR